LQKKLLCELIIFPSCLLLLYIQLQAYSIRRTKFGVDVVKTGIDAANFVTDFEFTNELPYGIEFANELQYGVVPLDGFNVTFDLIDLYEQYKNWK